MAPVAKGHSVKRRKTGGAAGTAVPFFSERAGLFLLLLEKGGVYVSIRVNPRGTFPESLAGLRIAASPDGVSIAEALAFTV